MISIRVIIAILICFGASTAARAQDPDAGRLLASSLGCNKCHGERGVSDDPSVPSLAGQKVAYLRRQLEAFRRTGPLVLGGEIFRQRAHPYMGAISVILTNKNIESLAAFYGSQPCAKPRAAARRAEAPANARLCETCHGGRRANPFGYSPILNAQQEAYLISEMKAFIAGRDEILGDTPEGLSPIFRSHRIMSELLDGDIEALARYYTTLACR